MNDCPAFCVAVNAKEETEMADQDIRAPHVIGEMEPREFVQYLQNIGRSEATVRKYTRDLNAYLEFSGAGRAVDQGIVAGYKEYLARTYKLTSANSMLTALNCFLNFSGRQECCIPLFKVRRNTPICQGRALTEAEFRRLVDAAMEEGDYRLYMILEVLCATGIRVGELQWVTGAAVDSGQVRIPGAGRERTVKLPEQLEKRLRCYRRQADIGQGPLFVTQSHKPVDRSNLWSQMKGLCRRAGVDPEKVYPYNLRHLFGCTYCRLKNNLDELAEILGHASVDTARIYRRMSEERE